MSALKSYWSWRITSGAIQKGVPTKVQHLDMVAVSCAAAGARARFAAQPMALASAASGPGWRAPAQRRQNQPA